VLGLAVAYGQRNKSVTGVELPWFVVAFAVLVIAGSLGWIPAPAKTAAIHTSTALMLVAMSAIGMMTSLEAIWTVGSKVLLLLVLNSLVLAAIIFGAVALKLV
jgi:uncharacterized membrane protein YadS